MRSQAVAESDSYPLSAFISKYKSINYHKNSSSKKSKNDSDIKNRSKCHCLDLLLLFLHTFADSTSSGALMGFSYPALDSEHALVEVARQLAELCKERLPECKVTWRTRWLDQIERDAR